MITLLRWKWEKLNSYQKIISYLQHACFSVNLKRAVSHSWVKAAVTLKHIDRKIERFLLYLQGFVACVPTCLTFFIIPPSRADAELIT
jgi:hypothetical protein